MKKIFNLDNFSFILVIVSISLIYRYNLFPPTILRIINTVLALLIVITFRNIFRSEALIRIAGAFRIERYSFNIFKNMSIMDYTLVIVLILINSPIIVGMGNNLKIGYNRRKSEKVFSLVLGLSGLVSYLILIFSSGYMIKYLTSINFGLSSLLQQIFLISISMFIINLIPVLDFDLGYIVLAFADNDLTSLLYRIRRNNFFIFFIALYILVRLNVFNNFYKIFVSLIL